MSSVSKNKKVSARAVADLSQGTIIATVEIEAPPERVFRALTDSAEVVRWWGSAETYRTETWETDLRVGGRWRAGGRSADGSEFTVGGEFLEVDPPRKLVQTWAAAWDGGNVTTITYRLEGTATGTRVTVRHEGFAGRPESCQNHTEGWESVLGWLAGYVSPPAQTANDPNANKHFFWKLLPPRKSFPADITAEEREVMMAHSGYWRSLLRDGIVVVFGPVADPAGAWGLGVVEAKSEDDVRAMIAKDPAILAGRGFSFEIYPMMSAVTRG